jgi:hypothetical protein
MNKKTLLLAIFISGTMAYAKPPKIESSQEIPLGNELLDLIEKVKTIKHTLEEDLKANLAIKGRLDDTLQREKSLFDGAKEDIMALIKSHPKLVKIFQESRDEMLDAEDPENIMTGMERILAHLEKAPSARKEKAPDTDPKNNFGNNQGPIDPIQAQLDAIDNELEAILARKAALLQKSKEEKQIPVQQNPGALAKKPLPQVPAFNSADRIPDNQSEWSEDNDDTLSQIFDLKRSTPHPREKTLKNQKEVNRFFGSVYDAFVGPRNNPDALLNRDDLERVAGALTKELSGPMNTVLNLFKEGNQIKFTYDASSANPSVIDSLKSVPSRPITAEEKERIAKTFEKLGKLGGINSIYHWEEACRSPNSTAIRYFQDLMQGGMYSVFLDKKFQPYQLEDPIDPIALDHGLYAMYALKEIAKSYMKNLDKNIEDISKSERSLEEYTARRENRDPFDAREDGEQ